MWSLSLLATLFADSRDDPLQRPEVVWGVAGLAAALMVGAGVIYAVGKWRERATADPTESDQASALTSYREMFENGEITEVEYTELRRRVADKVKKPPPAKPEAAAKPDAPPAAPAPPAPPAMGPGERASPTPPAPPAAPAEPPPPPSTA